MTILVAVLGLVCVGLVISICVVLWLTARLLRKSAVAHEAMRNDAIADKAQLIQSHGADFLKLHAEIERHKADAARWKARYEDAELRWVEETGPKRDFAAEHDFRGVPVVLDRIGVQA